MISARKKFGPLRKATKGNIDKLPESPGVYGLFSEKGDAVYIGKVKRGRAVKRLGEHKNEGKIPFKKFGFISTESQESALRLEKGLINSRKPKFNKDEK